MKTKKEIILPMSSDVRALADMKEKQGQLKAYKKCLEIIEKSHGTSIYLTKEIEKEIEKLGV